MTFMPLMCSRSSSGSSFVTVATHFFPRIFVVSTSPVGNFPHVFVRPKCRTPCRNCEWEWPTFRKIYSCNDDFFCVFNVRLSMGRNHLNSWSNNVGCPRVHEWGTLLKAYLVNLFLCELCLLLTKALIQIQLRDLRAVLSAGNVFTRHIAEFADFIATLGTYQLHCTSGLHTTALRLHTSPQ